MTTLNQYAKKLFFYKKRRITRSPGLCHHPFKSAIIEIVRNRKPKKPNSAQRKTAKVCLSTGRRVNCYIPGQGNQLRKFNKVLVRGGRVKDLPGIQYHLVRGKFDFFWKEDELRVNKKTKYGVPKQEKEKEDEK